MEYRAIIEFAVGVLFVSIYAFSRFSNTREKEQIEVSSRYIFALFIYMFLSIFVYFLLWFLITTGIAIPYLGIGALLDNFKDAFSKNNQIVSAQLLAALLMTEALPRIKKASDADNELRVLFQRMASLSSSAQSLSSKFQYEALYLQDDNLKELVKAFSDRELDQKYMQIKDSDENAIKPKHYWTRISLLWISLNKWKKIPEYRTFLNSHSNGFDQIKDEVDSLSKKVKYCFKLSDASENDPELKRALKDCADHYSVQLKKHLQKVADFMSCALLSVKKGKERIAVISQMGYKAEYNQGLSVDLLMLMFIVILLILITGFGFSQWSSNGLTSNRFLQPRQFIIAIMVASIYSLGIVCAIMAKKRCDKKEKDHHAWATYFFTGIIAALIGSIISICVNTILQNWNLVLGLKVFVTGIDPRPAVWPWQLMVFTTTFFTTFLLNRKGLHQNNALIIRLTEAGSMVTALLLTLFVILNLMGAIDQFFLKGLIVFPIGFSIGYLIPTWYRGAPKLDKDQSISEMEFADLPS